MFDKKDLELLKQERAKAIANCEFPKAKLIDLQIKKITADLNQSQTRDRLLNNQLEYNRVKESVKQKANRAYATAVEAVYSIKAQFQGRVASLLEMHTDELSRHTSHFAADLELETIRPVPDSRYMQREAQVKAKYGDFDRAEELFQESNSVQKSTVLHRQDEVRAFYDRVEGKMKRRHNEDIWLNHEKKVQRLLEVKCIYEKEVEKLRKQLANMATKYQVQQNMDEEDAFFPELVINEEAPEIEEAARQGSGAGSPRESSLRRESPRTPKTPKTLLSTRGSRSPFSPRTPKSPRGASTLRSPTIPV